MSTPKAHAALWDALSAIVEDGGASACGPHYQTAVKALELAAAERVASPRKPPRITGEEYGLLYVVIDDEGEPVTSFVEDLVDARTLRAERGPDGNPAWDCYRIACVGYKLTDSEVTIADDPLAGIDTLAVELERSE